MMGPVFRQWKNEMTLDEYLDHCRDLANDLLTDAVGDLPDTKAEDLRHTLWFIDEQVQTLLLVEDHHRGELVPKCLHAFLGFKLEYEREMVAEVPASTEEARAQEQAFLQEVEHLVASILGNA